MHTHTHFSSINKWNFLHDLYYQLIRKHLPAIGEHAGNIEHVENNTMNNNNSNLALKKITFEVCWKLQKVNCHQTCVETQGLLPYERAILFSYAAKIHHNTSSKQAESPKANHWQPTLWVMKKYVWNSYDGYSL